MRLKGKVALVTGAGFGIGRAIALTLAREGADVIVADVNPDTAREVAESIRGTRHRALDIRVDVSKSVEVNEMVGLALRQFGQIDILVNNAGGGAREKSCDFNASSEEIWDSVIGRNIKGTLNCTRAIINHMIQRETGKIVNIGSVAGVFGRAGMAEYSTAKGGVIAFTMALAKEVGQYKINVNCISPGAIFGTAATANYPTEGSLSRQALKRLGEPQDIANAVVFLASEEASFITAHNLVVSGGAVI